jgi:Ca2+-binding RTX toxin-like protein
MRRKLASLAAAGLVALVLLPSWANAYVYWGDGSFEIGRASLDGMGVNRTFISTSYYAYGVAVDAGHVYWTNYLSDTIGRANLDGTRADQSFITSGSYPADVAVNANHVYWTNSAAGTIGRANLDGTGVDQSFIAAGLFPNGVVVDAGHIYWTDSSGTISRANLNGTGINQRFIVTNWSPQGVAVDPLGPTEPSNVSVSVQGTALTVAAGPAAKDNLVISRPSRFTVRVSDFPNGGYTGSVVHAGAGCTRSGRYTATCPASGITPALPVLVTAGDRADRVVNSSGLPSSIYGGGGKDALQGGTAGDILKGGPGADVLEGLGGDDLLQAHDGRSDRDIGCGEGGDKAYLDPLPRDSSTTGCEAKVRH